MLAIAESPDAIGTRDVSGRPRLSAAAGAKSREEPGQERPGAALNREHGSDEPFGANSRLKRWPARSARRQAKSELAQVRAHHGYIATGPARVNSPQVRPAHLGLILRTRRVP